ncbi:MAG: outer membrane protein insertion porin family [Pseudomonadota bacterium]|jgi:outer membrane protein insertion porin family|nr:outer membrane protein insertion porin family [Pseudomonadota bacterium]
MGLLLPGSRFARALLAAMLLMLATAGHSQVEPPDADKLLVRNIRVEGLQRIAEGTVFNYLPVNIGDRIDQGRIQEAIRAIYGTGFFRDVEIRWESGSLIIVVSERPSIASFSITGNKDIKTEDLQEPLARIGLKQGRIFNQSVLDEVEQSLIDQYFSRGKYAANVTAAVESLPDNKVAIAITIKEGDRARIRQINLVGNSSFSDEEILERFELKTPTWLSFIRQDDRYSREALSGDLETLRSYYMDRGFADFNIESTQVAISPDKRDIFVTINLLEGDRYRISDVRLAGDLVLTERQLNPFVVVKPGQSYSQQLITQSADLIRLRLSEEGYAFATVDPVPELDREAKTAAITLYVEPKSRVYVRRVNFNGTSSINDDVLRREVRQLENGYLSNSRLERSKIRLQRLPYIEKVEETTNPVPGTPDLVDLDFDIKEGLPGQFGGGVGYSQSQKLIFNGNFVHTNFMGSGNRVQADINTGQYRTVYGISYTDPYTTINEVSRTISLAYRDITQFTSDASDFSTKTFSVSAEYSYPVTEYQRLIFGGTLQSSELLSDSFQTEQAQAWVRNNGDSSTTIVPGGAIYETKFDTVEMLAGWVYDTRNRGLFADRGARHRLTGNVTVPGSDVEYYTINYNYQQYLPVNRWATFLFSADVGYGAALGDTTSLPPYRNYFAGGPDTVRGYRENDLGPKDTNGNPYGGDLLTAGQIELLLPIPEKWEAKSRFTLFFDIGNVFSVGDVVFYDQLGSQNGNGQRIDYGFDAGDLKRSYGIAAQWLAPLGLFRFSYAFPLDADSNPFPGYSDSTERFQFSIGGAF